MGRPIVYCSDCGRSLREDDFNKGLAGNFDNRPFCSTCRTVAPPPSTSRNPAISSTRTPKPFAAAPPPAKKSPALLIAASVCGAALVILLVGVSMGGDRPLPPPPPPPPPKVVDVPPPPKRDPNEERAAFEREQRDKFEKLLKELKAAVDDEGFYERRDEIKALIAKANDQAGPRKSEVDGLSAMFTRKTLETGVKSGLVGWYKLDDLMGTSAADASGNNYAGKVVGKPAWTAAKVGSGLETFGTGEFVELPDVPALKSLNKNSFSVALWYLPRELPVSSPEGAMHGLLAKPGYHTGLLYLSSGSFRFELWHSKGQVNLASDKLPPGRFYHLAGTADTQAGVGILYIDGVKVKELTWAPTTMRDYGGERWRVGAAFPAKKKNWGPSKGVLDDVRLYNRVLSPEEIRFLVDQR